MWFDFFSLIWFTLIIVITFCSVIALRTRFTTKPFTLIGIYILTHFIFYLLIASFDPEKIGLLKNLVVVYKDADMLFAFTFPYILSIIVVALFYMVKMKKQFLIQSSTPLTEKT
jgi:hypothetical protein